ncbi:MAG TPA: glycoside hydrolase family 15 protein [Gaiellaceae bacterium]|nr:glycoside hydrolase family 15 protein [Gaiellaceae bacterium]
MRVDGYAPIEDYAAIGDGRTVGLVARDGSLDWLCLPDLDSPPAFGRLLDAEAGGSFVLQPAEPCESDRRYLPDTNVLETTYRSASGTARVTDAMTIAKGGDLPPLREVVRRVEGLAGSMPFRWIFDPRFGYGRQAPSLRDVGGRLVAVVGKDALALGVFGAAAAEASRGEAAGRFEVRAGEQALLVLTAANREPLVLPDRDAGERRLEATASFWRAWAGRIAYDGPWRNHVVRSALALKLLVHSPSGAIVAAATTSLPEWIGGERNWDYRFAWVRDAALTLVTFLRLGFVQEPRAFLWWLAHATALTHPRLDPLYSLDGGPSRPEEELARVPGYRDSRPVRVGNGARDQLQLDVYGYALHAFWRHTEETSGLSGAQGRTVAKIADWVADHWREPDSGIWEVRSAPTHFIQSKAMCAVALERACDLAEKGLVPDRRVRWAEASAEIRAYVDERGWDERRQSFVRAPDLREADGSLLTLALLGYEDARSARIRGLIRELRSSLGNGSLLDRYRYGDGLRGPQGIFITCSFWLASVLARAGEVEAAADLLDRLVLFSNDVGLYAEEVEPGGRLLGNFPQALVHLALIDAALDVAEAPAR